MSYKKAILTLAAEETGWTEYKGEFLPESTKAFQEKTEMFQYPGGWSKAYYKGDLKAPLEWIIVTNNGGFYKVDATFIVWTSTGKSVAAWTSKHMKKIVIAFFKGMRPERDPNYQS